MTKNLRAFGVALVLALPSCGSCHDDAATAPGPTKLLRAPALRRGHIHVDAGVDHEARDASME